VRDATLVARAFDARRFEPVPLVKTEFNELNPQFSPDSRWVAYNSDESGRPETYLTPFTGPGSKRQVSLSGGLQPRWRADGRELFFVAPDGRLVAAEVALKPGTAEIGATHSLFGEVRLVIGARYLYDVSADGQRVIATVRGEQPRRNRSRWSRIGRWR
jgi:hypothetical protein